MGSRPKKLVSTPPEPPAPTPAVKTVAAASLNPNAQKYLSFVAQLNTQFRSQMWKVFVDESADAILLLDQDLRCAFVNRTLEQICGHTSDEMLGLALDELPVNFLTAEFTAGARRALVSGASGEFDIECQQEAGCTQHRRIRLIPEVDAQACVLGVLCIAKDITEFKEAERKLGAAQLIANISYWEWDYRTETLTGTRLGREVLGLSSDSLTAEEYNDMIPPAERDTINALYQRAFAQGLRDISYEHGLVFPDGSRKEMQNWVRLEYSADGRAIRAIGVTQDVTRMIALQRETHQLAFYDPLTKLPNRALLHDKLQKALDEATAKQRNVGLIMLDIDHFQKVNDSMGYASGDALLQVVGERLSQLMRDSDTVARLGGDEFAIILQHIRQPSDVETIVQRIWQLLAIPVPLPGSEIIVTASAGIAIYPQDGAQAAELLAHADSAMFHAKELGRNNFQFYARELTASSQERVQLESDLRKALDRGELELFYQPKIDLADGQIVGAEALMRWRHPKRGLVPPDKFISIAEETGLIIDMGAWALRSACRTAKEWNTGRETPLVIAVNLSPRQFYSGNIVATMQGVLRDTGVDPAWIELEITESLLLNDRVGVSDILKQLHDMGLSIAIDDFGTGYSSLSYLTHFPVDTLKIDRSFVNEMTTSSASEVLVQAIVALGHSLHMQIVAEGIEDTAQRDRLRSFGCHFAQGYLFSKPLPSAEFTVLMNSRDHDGVGSR